MQEARILIVDDNEEQLASLRGLLASHGYRVRGAKNGRDALQIAREGRPHLIISDIEMPVMNGYQLCTAVKSDNYLGKVPVILVTTLSRSESVLRALEARADYYLTKPYNQQFLLNRIRTLIDQARASAMAALDADTKQQAARRRLEESLPPLEILLGGMRHRVTAGREQMLNLLMCTYEHAVQQNQEYQKAQRELEALNDQLYSQTRQLKNSEANYRALLENNLDAILVVDQSGTIRFANPAAQELLMRPRHELIGSPCEFLLLAGDVREVDIARSGHEAVVAQLRVVETFWEGEVAYLASLHDITERKRYERKIHEQQLKLQEANANLQALATLDSLTGLLNRRAFREKMLDEMRRSARYGWPLTVLLMDVDKFKQYNDTFGHPAGDVVLKTVAHLLQEQARSSDIVARYGGEEFIVLLPNTDREAGYILAERVRVAIERAPWTERAVTASLGTATIVPQVVGDDALLSEAERLIETADQALYRSKEEGRNRVTQA